MATLCRGRGAGRRLIRSDRRTGKCALQCLFVEEMTGYLHEAGFQVEQVSERDPYAFEYQSRRVYILGSKR